MFSTSTGAKGWLRWPKYHKSFFRREDLVHLELQQLENRDLLSWTPFALLDPGTQVNAISAGVTPGSPSVAVYAIGLDNQVYSAFPSIYLLTPDQVKQISAYPALVGGSLSYVFAIGLDNQIYYTYASTPGNWIPFTLLDPGTYVKSISAGVTPGSSNLAVYAIGLDNQVYNVYPGAIYLLTPDQVEQISAFPFLVNGNQSYVFAIGLDNQIYYSYATTPGPSAGGLQFTLSELRPAEVANVGPVLIDPTEETFPEAVRSFDWGAGLLAGAPAEERTTEGVGALYQGASRTDVPDDSFALLADLGLDSAESVTR